MGGGTWYITLFSHDLISIVNYIIVITKLWNSSVYQTYKNNDIYYVTLPQVTCTDESDNANIKISSN